MTCEVDNFFPGQFDYVKVRVADEESVELLRHWDDTYRVIRRAHAQGHAVLVHCKRGISRSSSTVVAYLMKARQMGVDEALEHVKSRRQCVTPNAGFLRQLHTYAGILAASAYRNSQLFNRPIVPLQQANIGNSRTTGAAHWDEGY